MATPYHLNSSIVSLGKGHSVIAKAAYNAREKFCEERTGETKDYSRKKDRAMWSGLFVDKDAPAWAHDRESFWNAADTHEHAIRKDSQIAYNIIAALPHQLTDEQREFIVKDFAREQFLRRGVVADVHIHEPRADGDDRNYHVHMLVSMREMTPEGFGPDRVFEWNDRFENLDRWREQWAARSARELEKSGLKLEAERWREGHKTFAGQRQAALERGDVEFAETLKQKQATKHRGPQIDAIERKGIKTGRDGAQRESVTAQQEFTKLKRELTQIEKQIAAVELETHRELPSSPVWELSSPAFLFDDAAPAVTDSQSPDAGKQLRGTSARIWAAYNVGALPEQQKEQQLDRIAETKNLDPNLAAQRDPYRFFVALRENGIRLAIVTKEEAEQSYREAEFAKAVGNRAPTYREGEFVAMNHREEVYRFTGRNTGDNPESVQTFLAKAEWTSIQGLDATRQGIRQERQDRTEWIAAARAELAKPSDRPRLLETDNIRAVLPMAERAASRGVDLGAKVAAAVFGIVGNAVESLLAPSRTPTLPEIRAENERQAAAGVPRDPALEKFIRDEEYLYVRQKQKEQVQEQQKQRDYYERQKENERGR